MNYHDECVDLIAKWERFVAKCENHSDPIPSKNRKHWWKWVTYVLPELYYIQHCSRCLGEYPFPWPGVFDAYLVVNYAPALREQLNAPTPILHLFEHATPDA